MKRTAGIALLALAVALPSCGDDSSPTNPDTPSLNPAQLTVQISVSQATASTEINATGPATQQRTVASSVTVSNDAGSADAVLLDLRIFGAIIAGQDAWPIDTTVEPSPPQNSVPGGQSVTINTAVDVEIEAPFQVTSFFDISVEVRYTDSLGNSGTTPAVSTSVDPSLTERPPRGCGQSSTIDCLNVGGNGRFRVEVTWADAPGAPPQPATVGQQFFDGAFWFFSPDNVELLVQVIDNCNFNDHFWVFMSADTDLEVNITVDDRQNNVTKSYRNPLNTSFQSLQDTNAFATCPGP